MPIKIVTYALAIGLLATPTLAAPFYTSMSGGVTSDERQQIDTTSKADYSLKVQFARPSGEFVTDVQVTIRDSSGKIVVNAPSPGPYFLVALPAGAYQVTGQVDGESKTQNVTVNGAGQKSITLRYSQQP